MAREIGVEEALLGRWVAIERAQDDDPPEALDLNEPAELERLRVEVAELRMDRDTLGSPEHTAFDVGDRSMVG